MCLAALPCCSVVAADDTVPIPGENCFEPTNLLSLVSVHAKYDHVAHVFLDFDWENLLPSQILDDQEPTTSKYLLDVPMVFECLHGNCSDIKGYASSKCYSEIGPESEPRRCCYGWSDSCGVISQGENLVVGVQDCSLDQFGTGFHGFYGIFPIVGGRVYDVDGSSFSLEEIREAYLESPHVDQDDRVGNYSCRSAD